VPLITSILAFVFVLGVLVFVHELGHFLVAKKSGMKVEEFSLGFPPKAVGIKVGDTEYCLSWLPLGGYVKVAGMADFGHEESKGEPWEFQSKPRWMQMSVMVAGPFMNFLLGFLLLFGIRMAAGEYDFLSDTRVGEVKEASPLYDAGLLPGDRILSVGNRPIVDWEEMSEGFFEHMGKTVAIAVEREENKIVLNVDLTSTPQTLGIDPYITTEVGATMPGMPAEEIGLQPGDIVTSVAGVPVTMWWEMSREISKRPNEAIEISWVRENMQMSASLIPEEQMEGENAIGRIGINTASKRTPISIGKAFVRSGQETIMLSTAIFGFVKRLVVGQESGKQLAGPVGIFQMVGQQAERGFSHLIWFMAMLSINLGVLNLLPIPMLDGGHLLILSIEAIARRDLSSRHKEILQQAGFVFLLFLIIYVTFNDIGRLFG
jgi:regulator of sigma E protease